MSFRTKSKIENILGREQHVELSSLNGKDLAFKKFLSPVQEEV